MGETCRAATPQLQHLHLLVNCSAGRMISSPTVALGRIARVTDSAGHSITSATVHSTVYLDRSTGPAVVTTTTVPVVTTTTVPTATTTTTIPAQDMTTVPNLVGLNESQVAAAM